MSYYGSFVLQCYVLRMRAMTSTVGGNLTNRPPVRRHIHVNKRFRMAFNQLSVYSSMQNLYVTLVHKHLTWKITVFRPRIIPTYWNTDNFFHVVFIKPLIMHYLSYTKSRWLTNTPTRFGARCRHLQWVPLRLLTSQHINWLSNFCLSKCCRKPVSNRNIRYLK